MAVVSKTVLKSYFNDGDVPTESNYIDLIDTMGDGDMLQSVFDANNIVNANDLRMGGGIAAGGTTINPPTGTGYFRVSVVSGTYNPNGGMDNIVIEQNGQAGITLITPAGSSAYLARMDRSEETGWEQGIRLNSGGSIDLYSGNVYILQAFSDRVYIADDLRVARGLWVGSNSAPGDNNIHADNDIKAGGGFIVGSNSADPATGTISFYNTNLTLSRHDATNYQLRITTPDGYATIGPQDATYCHFGTDRAQFYFGKIIAGAGDGRFAGGVYAGSSTTDAPAGCFIGSGDIRMAGGLVLGNSTANPDTGQIWFVNANCRIYESVDHIRFYNTNGTITMGANTSNQAYFTTSKNMFMFDAASGIYCTAGIASTGGLFSTYASSTADSIAIQKHVADGHIYLNYSGSASLYFNYYGGTTTITRIMNGSASYGDIHADNFVNESTTASKQNIRAMKNEIVALDVISKMKPKAFEKENTKDHRRIGFLAEDLAKILPEVVAYHPETHLPEGISYGQIVPLLVMAIQELKEEIRILQ